MKKLMVVRTTEMNRRQFLTGAVAGATASLAGCATSEPRATAVAPEAAPKTPFAVGEPVLQVPAETSMGVSWAVNALSTGCVEVADNPEMKNARRVRPGGLGLVDYNDLALQVNLTGLKPATKYWYRTRTRPFLTWENAYNATLGEEVVGAVRSFTTLGANAPSHFCVINDTHAQWEQFKLVTDKVRELAPPVMLWNGDALNTTEDAATAREIFLAPREARKDFAAETPFLFVCGNHEFRGRWTPRLSDVLMERLPSERGSRDWDLRRNFAVRVGDIALVGLDTGEDKPDCHEKWFGLANHSPCRKAQVAWLEDQLKRPEIAQAPYLVAACHIPLFDPDPDADAGVVPHPTKFALWQKECADLWSPVFERHGVQLVIAAHRHAYRYDAPAAGRPWAQLVAGGCASRTGPASRFPTVLDVKAENGALRVRVHNLFTGRIVGEHRFAPRRTV